METCSDLHVHTWIKPETPSEDYLYLSSAFNSILSLWLGKERRTVCRGQWWAVLEHPRQLSCLLSFSLFTHWASSTTPAGVLWWLLHCRHPHWGWIRRTGGWWWAVKSTCSLTSARQRNRWWISSLLGSPLNQSLSRGGCEDAKPGGLPN